MQSQDEGNGGENGGSECATGGVGVMTGMQAVEALTNDELLSGTRRLVCQSNRVLAALLAHLAEVEARGLHRTRACASLYTYCIYELRMSEDAAYRRVGAARLVKRFPVLLGAVERGELHLTALLLIGPHLTDANVGEVVARAKFRTKKEVVKLVRLLSPLPDVPSRIEPLGLEAHRPAPRATWGNLMAARCPVRELQPDERPGNWLPPSEGETFATEADDPATAPALARSALAMSAFERSAGTESEPTISANVLEPAPAPARNAETGMNLDGPQRFKVQFTASEEYVALVEEAKALLAHALPRADLAEIHLCAVRTLVAELKKRKFATAGHRKTAAAVESADGIASPSTEPSTHRTEPTNLVEGSLSNGRTTLGASQSASALSVSFEPPRQRDSELSRRPRDRYVAAAVRRAVLERDGRRCAYVDSRGQRCRETSRLEFHHREPFARGGLATVGNLAIYCTAHNALAAEQDFGREHAMAKRTELTHFTERDLKQEL